MNPIINKMGMLTAMLLTFLTSSAYDFEVEGIYYNITDTENNEVAVTYRTTSYASYSGDIVVPETVSYSSKQYKVTTIGNDAFYECSGLTSISLPNSITSIGEHAFCGCTDIKSLVIGPNVKSIGELAGWGTRKLKKVIWLGNTRPSGAEDIASYTGVNYVANTQFSLSNQKVYPYISSRFEVDNTIYVPVSPADRTCDVIDCNYQPTSKDIFIDSIVVNRGIELKVLNINEYAFYNNDSIENVIINNKGRIGTEAFCNCDALTSVTASNNGHIGGEAFSYCDALTSVTASNNGYIGSMAFYRCNALTSVTASNNGNIG